jgi:hypothetical protein
METLIDENRALKSQLQVLVGECDELRERSDTLKYLEEEASEENEILRFKVASLEGQAIQDGQDLSEVKIVDELKLAKRELTSELQVLKT